MLRERRRSPWRLVPGLLVVALAFGAGSYLHPWGGGPRDAAGVTGAGDEPTTLYTAPAGTFGFRYPRSWSPATRTGATIGVAGRDGAIDITLVETALTPLDYADGDAGSLAAAFPGFRGGSPKAVDVAGRQVIVMPYTWQPEAAAGGSAPTHSLARRYYIGGTGRLLALFTYSAPARAFDPSGADDFASAFRWGK